MVKVAAVQMKVTKNPDKNLRRMLVWLKKANDRRADIACFPETSIVSNHEDPEDVRIYLPRIQEACKRNRIHCIFTSYEKHGKQVYNAGYIINDLGKIVHKYRKVNLWGIEKKYITPGKSNRVVKTRLGNIGMIICADFAYPQHVAKLKKADIIFCPSFMIDWYGRTDVINGFPVTRAHENMSYFVLCDAFNSRTAGISTIASPFNNLVRIERKEGMVIADLNIKRIRDLKKLRNIM